VLIWREVLKAEKIGVSDDFFALGGHSLLAVAAITRINKVFGTEIPVKSFFQAATVKELGKIIDHVLNEGGDISDDDIDFEAEIFLASEIRLNKAFIADETPNNKILLTGVTGFLGTYLLYELLSQTQAHIYCLVRAADKESGMKRIKDKFQEYLQWDKNFESRIIPICGDLSAGFLGLSADKFKALANDIDTIYHNGALVNLIYPYSELKKTNVDGVRNILQLACESKIKPLHYISTTGVLESSAEKIVYESTPPGSS
jgi:FlaA1/EpsC-like NDP-sugar epimerase